MRLIIIEHVEWEWDKDNQFELSIAINHYILYYRSQIHVKYMKYFLNYIYLLEGLIKSMRIYFDVCGIY